MPLQPTDGHAFLDFSWTHDSEYIYFIGSQVKNVEITNGMTNLYVYTLSIQLKGIKKGDKKISNVKKVPKM